MKTRIAAVALAAAALCAGSTLAQTRPQAPAPRAAVPAPPPAVGTVPAGQGQGQTRGTGGVGTFEGETALVVPTRPQAPGPRTGVLAPPPAVGTAPAGQGQTRGGGDYANVESSNRDHIDQDAQSDVRGAARLQTNLGATPVNGTGGTGGGRYTSRPRVINNSETETGLAVGTVPAGQGQGQTRGIGGDGSNRDHLDQDAQMDVRGGGRMTTGETPTNGVGGTGGGRLAAPGGGDGPVAAEAIISTSRSNIKRPSSLAVAPEAGASPAPVPVAPR